eukprot:4404280-Amphidinium_carterae.1
MDTLVGQLRTVIREEVSGRLGGIRDRLDLVSREVASAHSEAQRAVEIDKRNETNMTEQIRVEVQEAMQTITPPVTPRSTSAGLVRAWQQTKPLVERVSTPYAFGKVGYFNSDNIDHWASVEKSAPQRKRSSALRCVRAQQ